MIQKEIIDNRYVIMKEIGIGGFATVYKAWAEYLERFVALKKIHSSLTQNAKFLDMFRQEAVSMAKLDHANIVRAIDYLKTPDNSHYLVMEYVKGRDLRYLLESCKHQQKTIPVPIILHIASEVLRGLNYAHGMTNELTGTPLGIVHRDISPGNIMIFFDGRVKLTDFGIAKSVTNIFEAEKTGWLRGKIRYMSPEQAKGNVPVDQRSDLFSVGAVLWELLTQQPLFQGDGDYYALWQQVLKAKVDWSLLEKVPSVQSSPALRQLLEKALERDPEKRFSNAVEMLEAIGRCVAQGGYGEQRLRLKEFVTQTLKNEIQQEGGVLLDVTEGSSETPASGSQGSPKTEVVLTVQKAGPSWEGEKTVFDFVLDTAKRYKKIFLLSSLGLTVALLLGLTGDILWSWTPLGTKIHDWIWPPALTIDTQPSGASVRIEKDGKSILGDEGAATPLHVGKIAPGNYLVTISKEGYKKIERKIFVAGGQEKSSQDISLSGGQVYAGPAGEGTGQNVFIIPLEVTLRIKTVPSGATVFSDGRKLSGRTPLVHDLEVGQHSVKVTLPGFDALGYDEKNEAFGQCHLDLQDLSTPQKGLDRRYWSFQNLRDEKGSSLELVGTFWKPVTFRSSPPEAEIFLDNEPESRGLTPLEGAKITVGQHTIVLRKPGFQEVQETLSIDANTPPEWSAILKKWITFQCLDEETNAEAHAQVYLNGEKVEGQRTPFQVALPVGTYQVRFVKGENREAVIKQNTASVSTIRGLLKRQQVSLKILVTDEDQSPLKDIAVIINKKPQGMTDTEGFLKSKVDAGKVEIIIQGGKSYGRKSFLEELEPGAEKTLNVVFSSGSNCVLTVDMRPHFPGAKIFLNGDQKGTTVRKITGLSKKTYTLMIQHPDLQRTLVQRIEFTQPGQSLTVKIDEDRRLTVSEDQQ